MQDIYKAVSERLQSKVPGLRYIDLDSGQIDSQGILPAGAYPCALIDIAITRCDEIDAGCQNCTAEVTVRIAQEAWMDETSNVTPSVYRQKALDKIKMVDQVYSALQGFGTDEFDNLSRIRVSPDRRSDGLKVYSIVFATNFTEDRE